MIILTEKGKEKIKSYIAELEAKRKEILDAGLDTADDTNIPTEDDIICDIEFIGVECDGFYYNCWGVTDNYNSDEPISLEAGEDFTEHYDNEKRL